MTGTLYVVGIGPGGHEHMTFAAREAIAGADRVVDYKTYLDLVAPLMHDFAVIALSDLLTPWPLIGNSASRVDRKGRMLTPRGYPVRSSVFVGGTGSDVGKSVIAAGICRILRRRGISVAPFKAQNIALNSAVTPGGAGATIRKRVDDLMLQQTEADIVAEGVAP